MTVRCLSLLHVTLWCCMLATQQATAQERRLAHSVPGMEQVRRIADLSYRDLTGTADTVMYGPALLYDVFLPADSDSLRPGVVFIHGGLVAGGTLRVSPKDGLPSYQQWGRLVAASGLVGITFSHRLNTNENVDTAGSDVRQLLAEVRRRAAEWRLDPERICIAVFSAGGPLASPYMRAVAAGAAPIRCIAFYYAYMDMDHAAVISPFRQAHPEQRLAALTGWSPRFELMDNPQQMPPLLVARAGRDAIPGINASIERFMLTALMLNQPVEFYNHPAARHGFDMTMERDERAAYIIAATLRFFHAHLGA